MLGIKQWVRLEATLAVSAALLLCCVVWLGVGLFHSWAHPALGWVPLPIMALLAAGACWRAAGREVLDPATRRFWRHMSLASVLMGAGIIANAHDAVGGPEPSQRLSTPTLLIYLVVLGIVMWALLRLPIWQRSRSDWVRFCMDACVILITSGVFVWEFSLRKVELWTQQTGSALPLLAIVMVAFVSVITFVKVAFAGAGQLDRQAIRILSYGTAITSACGGMSPFLVHHPYLSTTLVAVPVAAISIHLAADRQARSGAQMPMVRRRSHRISVPPYLAVAATDALLLLSGEDPVERMVMQISAVVLTALVIGRQITALRDNNRLLDQLQEYQGQLTRQATHDTLTGIPNRALFETEVSRLLSDGIAFHVALFDLDNFKAINDRLGHGMGDFLITTLSQRLRSHMRPQDTVARLGGDEFVVLLPETNADDVTAMLTVLVAAIHRPVFLNGNEIAADVSIGITINQPGDGPQQLLRRADVAMYAAKNAGGNQWTWFNSILDELADADARLGTDLRQAIKRNELFLMYQPIVGLPDGNLTGVEALLRWRHPEHGLVSPDIFIPLAEHNGFMVELGRWVLDQACQQAATWQREYGEGAPGKVSINVSPRQLSEPAFVAEVADVLHRTGIDPRRLMIEVTETAVLNTGNAMNAVRALHDLGLPIALDDFGTGQSSLSLLVDCPVDVLKVDRSFVSGITGATSRAVIVRSLIGITDALNIQAVAEGVESIQQARHLHEAGYRLAQGYLFGRPMTATDLTTSLQRSVDSPRLVS